MRWIALVLAASNLLLGLFSVYSLREADKRYSELIVGSVPVMNDLQTLTAKAARAMTSTNIGRLVAAGKTDGVALAETSVADEAVFRTQVLAGKWVTNDTEERQPIQKAGEEFTETARSVLAKAHSGDVQGAARERESRLIPAFNRYIDAITAVADVLEADSRRVNAAESQHTGKVANIMLGAAGWPVIVIVALLVGTAVFVLLLVYLFRSRELNNS